MHIKAMRPLIKGMLASMTLSAYRRVFREPPKRILLLPSTTMNCYNRIVKEYPEAEYYAVEKSPTVFEMIRSTNKFKKIYCCDIGDVPLEHPMDISYLDLQSTFTNTTLFRISEFLRNVPIPPWGTILAITLIQRPSRGANLVTPSSSYFSKEKFTQHVASCINKESMYTLKLRRVNLVQYRSGLLNNKTFIFAVYFLNTGISYKRYGSPWKPKDKCKISKRWKSQE